MSALAIDHVDLMTSEVVCVVLEIGVGVVCAGVGFGVLSLVGLILMVGSHESAWLRMT